MRSQKAHTASAAFTPTDKNFVIKPFAFLPKRKKDMYLQRSKGIVKTRGVPPKHTAVFLIFSKICCTLIVSFFLLKSSW